MIKSKNLLFYIIIGVLVALVVVAFTINFSGSLKSTNSYESTQNLSASLDCPKLDCSDCPVKTESTVSVTKYQCYDGTIQSKLNDCPSISYVESSTTPIIEDTVANIDLSVTINSASSTSSYIYEPVITLTNAGNSAVSNLVIDVEAYRDGKLIASEVGVTYISGSTYITSVPAGESVKGFLNLMIYNGSNNDFTSGTYLLKVIIRKGASATPIATAEKTVEIIT